MNLSAIQESVADHPLAVSGSVLRRAIARAVRYYSQWNPLVDEKTLTTVADQKEYEVTATCLNVLRCLWYPGSPITSDLTIAEQILATDSYVQEQPSMDVIHDINESASLRRLQGKWEWRSADRRLVLEPTPSGAGDSIYVTYAAPHALNAGSTAYETIPDEDLEIIRDLVIAEILMQSASEFAVQPDYTAGAEREVVNRVPGNAMMMARELRSGVQFKYSRPVGAIT